MFLELERIDEEVIILSIFVVVIIETLIINTSFIYIDEGVN